MVANEDDRWTMVPTFLVRHAGYPFDDLAALSDEQVAATAAGVSRAQRAAVAAAEQLKKVLRTASVPDAGRIGPAVGMLKPLPQGGIELPGHQDAVAGYRTAVDELARAATEFQALHDEIVESSRKYVTDLFGEPWRQQILLASSESVFDDFSSWSHRAAESSGAHTRKMTDLLVMYLQRITTKNETNAHFGPFQIGRIDRSVPGLSWRTGTAKERFTFMSHWSANELTGRLLSSAASRIPVVDPLVFTRDGTVRRLAFTGASGLPHPWQLVEQARRSTSEADSLLLRLVDGAKSVDELRQEWHGRGCPGDFDAVLAGLVADGLIGWLSELPVGEADVFPAMRELLAAHGVGDAAVDRMEQLVKAYSGADPDDRRTALRALNEFFEDTTQVAAVRNAGQHYGDRTVVFEECLSEAKDFRAGAEIERFVQDELSDVYDLLLAGPRLRLVREREVLRAWFADRFGAGRTASLGEVYEAFLDDRDVIGRDCDLVDEEVEAQQRRLADVLLREWDGTTGEVQVAPELLRTAIGDDLLAVRAICNPDVMLCAGTPEDLTTGDFLGVVGDAHAVRDLITHACFAPLVERRAPEVADEVLSAYLKIIDDDETLVDVVRAHTSKISARVTLPLVDLEVSGRSPRPREKVLRPSDLVVGELDGRLELRAAGVAGRIRLLASLSGAATIRHDPSVVFGFPRSLQGGVLRGLDRPHLPRIRVGRAVLTRRRWRLPAAAVLGSAPGPKWRSADAKAYVETASLAERFGLPRHVFVKFAHEPKPLYVDLASPLLVRQFVRAARGARPGDHAEFSEMLPSPEHLWLEMGGNRYTAELRCAVVSAKTGA